MTSSRWPAWLPECFSGSVRRRTEADSEDGELEAFGAQSSPAQGGIEARSRELLHGHTSCAEANAHSASRPGQLNCQGNRPEGPVSGRTGSTRDCLPSEPTMAGSARHLLLHSHTTICEGSRAGLEDMEDTFNARVLAALKPVNAPNPQHFLRCISSSDLLDLPCNEPQAPAHRARNTYSSYFQYEGGQWTAQDASDDDDSPASASSGSTGTSGDEDNDPLETRDFPSKGDLIDITDTHPVPEDQRSWGSAQSV